jgi:DNA-binding transcriptional LysR family regulator
MEIQQLKCFEVVATELHFARAAERLGTNQPAVSRLIMSLEETLGTRLFNRSKRSTVTLTSSGQVFLPEARLILRQCERGEAVGRRAGRGEVGRIEIGYVASAALGGTVSDAVRNYRATAPDVSILLQEMETPRQIEALLAGRLDVGFIRARAKYPLEIKALPLRRDPLLVALPAAHKLAAKTALRAADVAGMDFLIPHFGEEAGFLAQLHSLGQAGGFSPHMAATVRDFVTVLTAVAAGLGVGLVPLAMANLGMPGIVFRPVADVELFSTLVLAMRHTEASPVVRQFSRIASQV